MTPIVLFSAYNTICSGYWPFDNILVIAGVTGGSKNHPRRVILAYFWQFDQIKLFCGQQTTFDEP